MLVYVDMLRVDMLVLPTWVFKWMGSLGCALFDII